MSTFKWFHRATLIAVFLLIFVGGFVRSSGAGMGCPDWPTCFGQWIPPIHESQLPSDYQIRYQEHGYADTTFNPVKTWTEYLNRLLGASVGFLVMGTAITSLYFWNSKRWISWWSIANVILVGAEGALGAAVVYSNLLPMIVTLHMLLALVIVFILIWTGRFAFKTSSIESTPLMKKILWLMFIAMTLQILLGTQVREIVDVIMADHHYSFRETWVAKIGLFYFLHRSMSWIPVIIAIWGSYVVRQSSKNVGLISSWNGLCGFILLEIGLGMWMAYGEIPVLIQPSHLVIASLLFGLLVSVLSRLQKV